MFSSLIVYISSEVFDYTVHFFFLSDDVTSSGTILEFRGVEIEFRSNGLLGKADFYTTMMALMSCFIMVSVATTVVDIIGAFIYDSFKNDKIEDDGERQLRAGRLLGAAHSGGRAGARGIPQRAAPVTDTRWHCCPAHVLFRGCTRAWRAARQLLATTGGPSSRAR